MRLREVGFDSGLRVSRGMPMGASYSRGLAKIRWLDGLGVICVRIPGRFVELRCGADSSSSVSTVPKNRERERGSNVSKE